MGGIWPLHGPQKCLGLADLLLLRCSGARTNEMLDSAHRLGLLLLFLMQMCDIKEELCLGLTSIKLLQMSTVRLY